MKKTKRVIIYTTRDGGPYVLFGTHYNEVGSHMAYMIEDGPHIPALRAVFRSMEDHGVIMETPNTDIN